MGRVAATIRRTLLAAPVLALPGVLPLRLLALTIHGLAALTLPHVLLEIRIARRERRMSIRTLRSFHPA